ncbi:adenylosuccinate lyase [Candidatus Gracilibacteria bacterium]|nr:adenylosuccinate lyase [Candidatus Gracilibacteria bacterium]
MQNFPISPLDGRYSQKVSEISPLFSEFGLMYARTKVEILWLLFLSEKGIAPQIDEMLKIGLLTVIENFSEEEFQKIKKIETTTNHDVKAVEYFIRELVPENLWSWIHFACTSEDINNTAYGLILKDGIKVVKQIFQKEVLNNLKEKSIEWKSVSMLCRTHGQNATPSTMGKEFSIFWYRAKEITMVLQKLQITAKINGATGTFSAHAIAFPNEDWISLGQEFIEKKLELDWIPLTSQIEPHDQQAAILNEFSRLSSVLIDLCRDVWGYISLGYFEQKTVKGEIGSSTMPHKVNPIDFENAEGNFKLTRGIARTLSDELPISRWQRDLTDSTLQRNLGLVFGHFLLGIRSLNKGLGKLKLNQNAIATALQNAPEVLTEAIQTVLRAHGQADAYEQLKDFSRGQPMSTEKIKAFIKQTTLPKEVKNRLSHLSPETYCGLSEALVTKFVK